VVGSPDLAPAFSKDCMNPGLPGGNCPGNRLRRISAMGRCMIGDQFNQPWNKRARDIVSHAFNNFEFCVRDDRCSFPAGLHRHKRIIKTMNYQGRHRDGLEQFQSAAVSRNGHLLPGDPGRVITAFITRRPWIYPGHGGGKGRRLPLPPQADKERVDCHASNKKRYKVKLEEKEVSF